MDSFLEWLGWIIAIGIGGAWAVAKFIAPIFVKQFERRMEMYAKQREIEIVDRLVEKMKAEVRRGTFEHETRFAALHARRADVIAEVYGACVDAEEAFAALTSLWRAGEWAPEEDFARAKAARDALQRFERVGLFLPRESLPTLRKIVSALDEVGTRVRFVKSTTEGEHQTFRQTMESLEAHGKVKRWLPVLRANLEEAFRAELGDAKASATPPPPPELPDAIEAQRFTPTVAVAPVHGGAVVAADVLDRIQATPER